MKNRWLITLIICCQWLVSNNSFASPKHTLSDIAKICLTSPFDCLEHIDKALAATPYKSRVYYEILQYKFEAMFNLQRNEELYQITKPWLYNDNLPLPFQITTSIYFAKSALHLGEHQESDESYLHAKALLGKMNDEYPSPIRIVQFANLLLNMDENETSYQLLKSLEKKHPSSPDFRFMVELHGNLGHAAYKLGDKNNALKHWLETKKWGELFGNKQQFAVILFNLAHTYAQLNLYDDAIKQFSLAIEFSEQAGDATKLNQAKYHLALVKITQEKFCTAEKIIQQIDINELPTVGYYNVLSYDVNTLKQTLKPCRILHHL